MEKTEVLQRTVAAIASRLCISTDMLNEQTRFVEDLGIDSLDAVELLMAAEKEFLISIGDDVLERTATIGEAVSMIMDLREKAETKRRQNQEETEKRLRELGPARLAWRMSEEKNSAEFIHRTGEPYFIYDGTPAAEDSSIGDKYRMRKEEAAMEGRYDEWLLGECRSFLGREDVSLDMGTAASVAAFSLIVGAERMYEPYPDPKTRYGSGFRCVVTPDGTWHDRWQMVTEGPLLVNDLFSRILLATLTDSTFRIIRRGRNGEGTTGTVTPESVRLDSTGYCLCGTWKKEGKGRPSPFTAVFDTISQSWSSVNGRDTYLPGSASTSAALNRIGRSLVKISDKVTNEFILGYAPFKLGIEAKTVTVSLARAIYTLNRAAVKGDVTFKDGRTCNGFDLLNASNSLFKMCVSRLIAQGQHVISLHVDGMATTFIPTEYIGADRARNTAILKGLTISEEGRGTCTFELSLCGRKSWRANYDGWGVRHCKGDVSVWSDSRSSMSIDMIASLLDRCLSKKSARQ